MDKHAVLQQYFGHSQFRAGQETLIDAILSGRDVLGVMPTGGGKSLCYQIPALLLPGLTVVVSPLISLMRDQVDALKDAGVAAAFLNSSLTPDEMRRVGEGVRRRRYKLLYVAPERLEGLDFSALMQEAEIPLVAVDEAHCISQWGQDFRPSYLRIPDFLAQLPTRPAVAAFTATATAQVRQDIVRLLGLRNPVEEITGFDRANLFFDVQRPKHKMDTLAALVEERPGKSGIVYCATRSGVEKVCEELKARGIPATRYHAGLSAAERQRNQKDFQFDRKRVMVATNAFGMGIDKSNVSFVFHYNMPKSIEAYYQEAGRAGRDGEAADCILLFSPGDVTTARFLIENGGSEELTEEEQEAVRAQDYQRLRAMIDYCKTSDCLRGRLLDYFGQDHPPRCGCCGTCRASYRQTDITREAQIILSCVKRVQGLLGYTVGQALLVRVLRGSRDQRVLALGLDALSTYGLLKDRSQEELGRLIDCLLDGGCLVRNPRHETLEPGPRAAEVLFHGGRVTMQRREEPAAASSARRRRRAGVSDSPLMTALKATRQRLAQEEEVPVYIVFSNASLADMEAKAPRTMAEFLGVSGVGQVKAQRYGAAFLETIRNFAQDGPDEED